MAEEPRPAFLRVQGSLGAAFGALGAGLARRPWVALLPIAVGLALSFGLLSVRFEDRVNKLWVEQGGRLDSELDYVEQNNGTAPGTAAKDQVLLTVAPAGVLNEGVLNEHLLLLRRIYSRISVTLEAPLNHPKCAHLSDAGAAVPTGPAGPIGYTAKDVCDRVAAPEDYAFFTPVLPCTRITPIDCFEEGNYDASAYEQLLTVLDTPGGMEAVAASLGTDELARFRELFGLWRYGMHCKSDPLAAPPITSCDACLNASDCVGKPAFAGKSDAQIRCGPNPPALARPALRYSPAGGCAQGGGGGGVQRLGAEPRRDDLAGLPHRRGHAVERRWRDARECRGARDRAADLGHGADPGVEPGLHAQDGLRAPEPLDRR